MIGRQVSQINELKDASVYIEIMKTSTDFGSVPNNEIEGWKGTYLKLKLIFKEIEIYFKDILKSSFPSDLSSFNLV